MVGRIKGRTFKKMSLSIKLISLKNLIHNEILFSHYPALNPKNDKNKKRHFNWSVIRY